MRTREENLKIFEENIPLAYFMANKYHGMLNGYQCSQHKDVGQICLAELWNSAQKYEPGTGVPFANFACTCIYNGLVNYRKHLIRKHKATVSLEYLTIDLPKDFSDDLIAVEDVEDEVCGLVDLHECIARMPERTRQIIALKVDGYTNVQIAKQLGVTGARVWQLLQDARRKIAYN